MRLKIGVCGVRPRPWAPLSFCTVAHSPPSFSQIKYVAAIRHPWRPVISRGCVRNNCVQLVFQTERRTAWHSRLRRFSKASATDTARRPSDGDGLHLLVKPGGAAGTGWRWRCVLEPRIGIECNADVVDGSADGSH